MRTLLLTSCLTVCAAAQTPAGPTIFTAKMDSYQVLGGASNKAAGTIRIFYYSPTEMRFDFTPAIPAGYTLASVSFSQGQYFVNGNQIYRLCGFGSGNPRPTCSQTGYVDGSGGDLQASDLLFYGYGGSKDVLLLLDLLQHNLVYVEATFKQTSALNYTTIPIRGQFAVSK